MSELKVGTIKFHSVEYCRSMGKLYAFITGVDVLKNGKGTERKHYWGEVQERDNVDELLAVMSYGGKWEHLPRLRK
jgi:hypothetical protein